MKIRFLLFTFILILVSACNVAEQAPQVDASKTQSNTGTANLANTNQIVSFRKDRDSLIENANSVVAYVEREGSYIPDDQIVHVRITGSVDSSDYSSITVDGTPVTFLTGSTDTFEVPFVGDNLSQDIKITFSSDNTYEEDEIMTLQIVEDNLYSYTMTYPSQMGIIVENNDTIPTVNFNGVPTAVGTPEALAEGASKTLTIELSNPSYKEITVPVRFNTSSSVANSNDHSFTDQTVTFAPGSTSETITFNINNDTFNELDEMMVIDLGAPTFANLGATYPTHHIQIQDANADPTYDISTADGTVAENADTETLTLTLNLAGGDTLEEALVVQVSVAATVAGEKVFKDVDYKLSKNYFLFLPGSTNGTTDTITLTGIDDNLYEENESITITVGDTDFATAGTASVNVVIDDNEDDTTEEPKVQFLASNYLTQEGATINVPISLGAPAPTNWYNAVTSTLDDDANVSVTTSTSPYRVTLDFSGIPAAGTTIVFNTLTGTETLTYGTDYCSTPCAEPKDVAAAIQAAFAANSNFSSRYTATVSSDDVTVVHVSGPQFAQSDEQIDFTYTVAGTATSGTDHSLSSGTFSIAAGTDLTSIPIMIYNDSLQDLNETVILTITGVTSSHGETGGILSTTLTIKEAGSLPSVTMDSSIQNVAEGSTANITLTLSGQNQYTTDIYLGVQDNSTEGAGVDYTAISTSDANCSVAANVVTINALATTCVLDIALTADGIDEPTEQLEIEIQQPNNLVIGNIGSHILNILDADAPPNLKVSFDPVIATVGGASALSASNEGDLVDVYFHLDNVSGYDMVVNYTLTGTATNPDDYIPLTTGSLVIPQNTQTGTIQIQTKADGIYESGDANPSVEETIVIDVIAGNYYTPDVAQDQIQIDLKDEDGDTPPSLFIEGNVAIDANENDIVNISYRLDTPSANAMWVQFTVDDTVACAAAAGASPNLYKCANIHTTPATTDASNLLSQLTGGIGHVRIPAGSTQGVLSFTIDADGTFEQSLHYSGATSYTRREQFRVTITDIIEDSSGSLGVASIDGIEAGIDVADDYVDINIQDLDVTPVAYFSQPTFKSQSEAAGTLNIPINLTSKSEDAVTYHIQIIQDAEGLNRQVDENDFTFTADSQPDGFLDAFGNLEADTTVLSEDDTNGSPTYANEALIYNDASSVIFEGQFTIPANENLRLLEIDINNDALYEGNEQFVVKIIDDPNESTYQWGVSYLYDEYRVTIQESSNYPQVTWNAGNLTTIAEGSAVEATIQGASNILTALALPRTNVDFIFDVSPISQHEQITFDIALSGTAANYHYAFFSKENYMLGDYVVNSADVGAAGTLATDYSATYSASGTGRLSVTVPPGSGFTSDEFEVQISQDYRYEPNDDTIEATFVNQVNVNLGSTTTHTLTIDDDADDDGENDGNGDYRPFIINNEPFTIAYSEGDDDGFEFILTDSSGTFKGQYITSVDASVNYANQGTLRAGGTTAWNTGTIDFLGSNNYTGRLRFNQESLGSDPRTLSSIDVEMAIPTEAELDSTLLYYLNPGVYYTADPVYDLNFSFEYKDLNLAISKGSPIEPDSNGDDTSTSHTCTWYRGLASCFGYNDQGQLGRGNSDPYGLNPGEDMTAQANALDLGSDSSGNPLYVEDMALGAKHTCALFGDGRIKCWGDNTYGQLGIGSSNTVGTSIGHMGDLLQYVDLGNDSSGNPLKAVDIEAAAYATCALIAADSNGNQRIKCWGRNDSGQLGIESSTNIGQFPTQMGDNLDYVKISGNFSKLTGGNAFFCAKLEAATDRLHCWGENGSGQLGLNVADNDIGDDAGEMASTSVVIDNISTIDQLVAGEDHVCVNFSTATYANFNTRCWGGNGYGQLGVGRLARMTWRFKEANNTSTYNTSSSGSNNTHARGCSYTTDNGGNNCTVNIGKLPTSWSSSYTYESAERLDTSGHDESDNYILRKPASNDLDNSESRYAVDVGVSNNQFVQLYYPTNSISGGKTFNCGAVQSNSGPIGTSIGDAVTVRCWGSNFFYNGDDIDQNNRREWGFLNNHGHSVFYQPGTDTNDGFMFNAPATDSCYLGGSSYNNSVCEFMSSFAAVGEDGGLGKRTSGYYAHGNYYVSRYYRFTNDRTDFTEFGYGFTMFFPGFYDDNATPATWTDDVPSTMGINHEMHANSHSKFSFPGATSIEIRSGAYETCALPKTGAAGTNNSIKCWGANHWGQLGVDWTGQTSCIPNTIGDAWSCGQGSSGEELTFNYSF